MLDVLTSTMLLGYLTCPAERTSENEVSWSGLPVERRTACGTVTPELPAETYA